MAERNSQSSAVAAAATIDADGAAAEVAAPPQSQPKKTPLAQMYALPIPVRTFPLPPFYPSNPLSWLHIAWVVLRQAFSRPPAEPSTVHVGIWDAASGSVHVKDPRAIRALWEQGFFGKGNLSRSEPNWFKRQQIRRGLVEGKVSEVVTEERRQERRLAKWERARAEQDTIRQTRLQEMLEGGDVDVVRTADGLGRTEELQPLVEKSTARRHSLSGPTPPISLDASSPSREADADVRPPPSHESQGNVAAWHYPVGPPVGPLELLALPNSAADLASVHVTSHNAVPGRAASVQEPVDAPTAASPCETRPPVGPMELLALPNSAADLDTVVSSTPPGFSSPHSPKEVRFSSLIESTTFDKTDPPSPNRSPRVVETLSVVDAGVDVGSDNDEALSPLPAAETEDDVLVDKEHLQLTPEEAFFLAFGLGALSVVDPATNQPIPTPDLFTLFRRYSHFPSRNVSALQPHDNFLFQYAVYHHYRSLGWVPRGGIKFGVDWLLYHRGPVFDHAEFGIIVLPAFTDHYWKIHGTDRYQSPRTWAWLHGVIRVLSRVMKTLVIAHVEVPAPETFEVVLRDGGAAAALALYRVREVVVRRWSANRNRRGTSK